jgi:hypothetical protein
VAALRRRRGTSLPRNAAGMAKTSHLSPEKFAGGPKNRTIILWYQKLAAAAQILD